MTFFESLWPDHIIRTMMEEHVVILSNLDKLEGFNLAIQDMDAYQSERPEFSKLAIIASNLLGAEPHHEREEQVLFAELMEIGIEGPPNVMKMEHVELRKLKHRLDELARNVADLPFSEFKEQLNLTASSLVGMLREHIEKEDEILYPCAVQEIEDDQIWEQMRSACDKIGYCNFTTV